MGSEGLPLNDTRLSPASRENCRTRPTEKNGKEKWLRSPYFEMGFCLVDAKEWQLEAVKVGRSAVSALFCCQY